MDKDISSSGYDLYEITQDEWILKVRGGAMWVGTFRKVTIYAVKNLGFKLSEIEIAAKEMIGKGHNAAHFGIYKGFINTFQKDFNPAKKAG
jgi:hypothetical protein